MDKQDEVLKIVKEDLLEELGKEDKQASLSEVKPEISVSDYFISAAIEELRQEKLVELEGESISLTDAGLKKAEILAEKHSTLERYFRHSRDDREAWEAASILEHYVSLEVIDKLKKISTFKRESIAITNIGREKRLITDIVLDIDLFERMISMGIFPGERIAVTNRIPDGVIVKIGSKKFALAEKIAEGIKVLKQ